MCRHHFFLFSRSLHASVSPCFGKPPYSKFSAFRLSAPNFHVTHWPKSPQNITSVYGPSTILAAGSCPPTCNLANPKTEPESMRNPHAHIRKGQSLSLGNYSPILAPASAFFSQGIWGGSASCGSRAYRIALDYLLVNSDMYYSKRARHL